MKQKNKAEQDNKVKQVVSSFNSRQERLYPTENAKEYKSIIEKMNLAELQDHAISLGFKPSHNRQNLEKTLISQFHKKFGDTYIVDDKKISAEKQKKIDSVLQAWK